MTAQRENASLAEHQSPYLDYEPPAWGTRGLAYLLIGLFTTGVVASVLIHLPETVSCPFVLIPEGGADSVRTSHDGTIEVCVRDGQTVSAGEKLFVVHSDVIGDRSSELAGLRVQRSGALQSRENAGERHAGRERMDAQEARKLELRAATLTRKLKATERIQVIEGSLRAASRQLLEKDLDSLKRELEIRKKIRESGQDIALRVERLTRERALGEMEGLRIRQEVDRGRVDMEQSNRAFASAQQKLEQHDREQKSLEESWALVLEELQSDLAENAAAQAKLRHEREVAATEFTEQKRMLDEVIKKADVRIAALEVELKHRHGNAIHVVAPGPGTVLQLKVRETGTFVRSGDVLCDLAASGRPLEAELTVSAGKIGRLTAEQRVKLLYDAFPYERHGVKHGSVRWVSPASVANGESHVFRVLAEPDEIVVRVDGVDRPLRPGMGGRAEIVVGRRAVISFAFEPLRQLQENLR